MTFVNADGEKGLRAQVNTIFRCQFYFFKNLFQPVQDTTVLLVLKKSHAGAFEKEKVSALHRRGQVAGRATESST